MTDTALNKFLGQGDDTVEAGFTPDPPTTASEPQPAVLFVNIEDPMNPVLKWWDGDSFEELGGGGAGTVTHTGALTSGKSVIGNGTDDITVSSLTAQFVGSSSGTPAAASMSTARLLGRTTAGSGVPEEISVGSGLSLAAGSLTASGGGLVLLESHTASSSASLDFTTAFSSTYDEYQIEIDGIVPGTNTQQLYLQFSTDGGANYSTSGYYWSANIVFYDTGGAAAIAGGNNVAGLSIFSTNPKMNTGTGAGGYATLTISGLNNTSAYTTMRGYITGIASNGVWGSGSIGGVWKTTTAVNAARFISESGDLASGTIRVYGLAK